MVVTGHGLLLHHFWSEYSATVVVSFITPEHANDARLVLGENWKTGRDARCLVFNGKGEALQGVIDTLVQFGADRKKIDSIARSIDHGEPFEVSIPCIPSEQLNLF